jgi:hypothetical protein
MADDAISRRSVLPALVAGTAALATLAPTPAEAARKPQSMSACGPCFVRRGQTLSISYFLPGLRDQMATFLVNLRTLDGQDLGSFEDRILSGRGVRFFLKVLSDGSCWLVRPDREVNLRLDVNVEEGGDLPIIGILIGLLLPAVQKVRIGPVGTIECSNNMRTPGGAEGLGPVVYSASFESCLVSS